MSLSETNSSKKRRIDKSLSINDALPGDIIMHILSFDSFYRSKRVCMQWKLHCERNENNKMRQLYQKFVGNSASSQTWIVHPKRRNPNAFEKEHGFKGPMNIKDAINNEELNDGDNILIHDGIYDNIDTALPIKQSINLYGLGKNAWSIGSQPTYFWLIQFFWLIHATMYRECI